MVRTERILEHLREVLLLTLIALTNYVSPDVLKNEEEQTTTPVPSTIVPPNAQVDPYPPYNVTINHLSPSSVEVSWNCRGQSMNDKYEVTLKPLEASYRVIETVPYNTCFLKLERLDPNTSYQVSVASISGRVRRRSSSVIFKTYMDLDLDYGEIIEDEDEGDLSSSTVTALPSSRLGEKDRLRLPNVRLVEITLVAMALILWAGAIVLFFHRWGKIRQLLPYQPDYREMKRNNSVCANCVITPHHQFCRPLHQLAFAGGEFMGPIVGTAMMAGMAFPAAATKAELVSVPVPDRNDIGCSPIRPRLNSFVVFDFNEAMREQAQDARRKSKSAENLEHYSSFSKDEEEERENVQDEDVNLTTEL